MTTFMGIVFCDSLANVLKAMADFMADAEEEILFEEDFDEDFEELAA